MIAKILTLPNGHGERKQNDETHIALQFSLLIHKGLKHMSLWLVYIYLDMKVCWVFHKNAFHKLYFSVKRTISTVALSGVQCRKVYCQEWPDTWRFWHVSVNRLPNGPFVSSSSLVGYLAVPCGQLRASSIRATVIQPHGAPLSPGWTRKSLAVVYHELGFPMLHPPEESVNSSTVLVLEAHRLFRMHIICW